MAKKKKSAIPSYLINHEAFIAAIEATGGNILEMATALEIPYAIARRYIVENPELITLRNEARKGAWESVLTQAEDNIKQAIMTGDVSTSWKYLAINDPKRWAEVERSETTVIHTTPADLEAFDRADSLEDSLITEKRKTQELADELARLKLALAKPSEQQEETPQ